MTPAIDKDGQFMIKYKDRQYYLIGNGIISDEQAIEIYEKLMNEKMHPKQCKRTQSQWKDDETQLFQYGLFAFMVKHDIFVENFTIREWEKIAEIVPTKDAKKCEKRWLFIQKLSGNKTKWTNHEDDLLKHLVETNGAKNWSNLAIMLFNEVK